MVLILLIPVFDILRFDIPSSKLYILTQVWSFSPEGKFLSGAGGDPVSFLFRGIFPMFLIFLSLPVWGATLGRFFCGWFCPVGAVFEIVDFVRMKITVFKKSWVDWRDGHRKADCKNFLYVPLSALLLIVALLAIAAFLSGLLISPAEIWRQVSSLDFSPFFIFTASGMIVLLIGAYLARLMFCSYICLFGITMMIPFAVSPLSLRIRFDTERGKLCTNCGRCDKACIMAIKPRAQKKVNIRCINCGECITACEQELGSKNGLLYYGFGAGKQAKKTLKSVGYNERAR